MYYFAAAFFSPPPKPEYVWEAGTLAGGLQIANVAAVG
jgi:hypothetical protein